MISEKDRMASEGESNLQLQRNRNTAQRFVAFLDIMGFKERVARTEHDRLLDLLTNFNRDITRYVGKYKNAEIQLAQFSDSIVLFSNDDTPESLKTLAEVTRGIMQTAIQMANIFLPKNRLILYTEGRKSPREEYVSDGRGAFQSLPLVVLVDETSASASEIFAGAIQDNDRGTIIGRRTFGKGLVQQPIEFRDGSLIRLTIARYYTPSGRCIQKPYEKGHGEEYENDLLERYERGEFFSADSIKQSGPQYKTRLGRTVYGSGGIMPDIFIPEDTSDVTSYYREAMLSGLVHQYAFRFTDEHRKELNEMDSNEEIVRYLDQQNVVGKFADFANRRGLRRRNLMLYKSRKLFKLVIYGNIINNVKDTSQFYEYINSDDPTVEHAVTLLKEGKSFPQAPKDSIAETVKKK